MKLASVTIKKNKTYLGPQSLPFIDFLPFSSFLSLNQHPLSVQSLSFPNETSESNINYINEIHLETQEILIASGKFAVNMCTITGQGVHICQEKGRIK